MRLQVNFRSEESDIPDTEPFTLEGLTRYQLNQQLLNTLIEEQTPEAMYRRYRAAGEPWRRMKRKRICRSWSPDTARACANRCCSYLKAEVRG